MKPSYARPAAAFILLLAGVFALTLALNVLTARYESGSSITDLGDGVYPVACYERVGGTDDYRIKLLCVGPSPDVSFVSFAPVPTDVLFNDVHLSFNTSGSVNHQMGLATIPGELLDDAAGAGSPVEVVFESPDPAASPAVALCRTGTAELLLNTFNVSMPMTYGVLATIALFGLILYFSKRDRMILMFSAYAFCLFVWSFSYCSQATFGWDAQLSRVAGTTAYYFAVVLGMAVCFVCCASVLPRRLKRLGSWPAVLGLCVAYTAVAWLMPAAAAEAVRFALYIVAAAALVVACGRLEHRPWVVLCGLAITQGLRLAASVVIALGISQAFEFALLRQLRALTLPYLMGCMVYVGTDFARRFRLTETLSDQLGILNKELDQKVADRTQELVEQQQKRQMFMTSIFHDLRTPLFVMRGCVDRMKDRETSGRPDETLRVLDDRLAFTSQLAEDLFSIAKLEDHALVMDTEPVNVGNLLEKVVRGSSVSAENYGVSVALTCGAPCSTWGDEMWLFRAFQNLLDNAIRYSRPAGGSVSIETALDEGSVAVTVSDNGVGIAADELNRIFDRYHRIVAHASTSSGLGLSIASQVIAQHGGTIEVESAIGVGTTFTVRLPLWSTEPEPSGNPRNC